MPERRYIQASAVCLTGVLLCIGVIVGSCVCGCQGGPQGRGVQQTSAVNLSPIVHRIDRLESNITARVDATAVRLEQTATAGRDVKTNTGWVIVVMAVLIALGPSWKDIARAMSSARNLFRKAA